MDDRFSDAEMSAISEFVAGSMGLHFPVGKWADLNRGLAGAARELGFESERACAAALMNGAAGAEGVQTLASHLTVGETYFFREPASFEALRGRVIPELARAGRRSLRVWSCACCTGEEAYSIAMAVRQAIADIDEWNISILATDINPRFLRKAEAGVYGEWSFRGVPPWLKGRFFRSVGEGRYEVMHEVRRMVRFAPLNLARDVYPSLANQTNAMDVIFCRNVLMYFGPEQVKGVLSNLHRAMTDGGWLVVGAGELAQVGSERYSAVHVGEAILHQKRGATIAPVLAPVETVTASLPAWIPPVVQAPPAEELARRLANDGDFAGALAACDRWIREDKLKVAGHYLRAVILQEQGKSDEAVRSLRMALYLDPGFIVAHFTLGNVVRSRGQGVLAERHLRNALELLGRLSPEEAVPESEGILAGRMIEIIQSLLEMEAVV